ncbi:MAG TPA: alcohol dehydrogenase catalytic domain-containing protein [Chthonomonadaceae bacterium]|nr:alcohol dehydrogenase catalytic domain-containing protein [Chthonomonadaceae bacterium]
MRVPRFVGEGRIEFGEKPDPAPGPGQLLVRVGANALCGSERGQFLRGSATTPGHEAAGTVVAAGLGTATPAGTRGAIFLMDYCGACRSCRLGHTNQCLAKRGDMGFNRDGGYGPLEVVSESTFFPTGDDVSAAEATLLLDIMGTGGHAIERARRQREDIESVLIAGAGPIGLGVLAMARLRLRPAVPIAITDFVPYRLRLAESLGGLPIDLNTTDLASGLRAHGLGAVDAAFDTTGRQEARQQALAALDKRGALVCIGHGEGVCVTVSPDLIAPERAVLGSEYFRFDELPGNLALLREHRDYLGRIITHRFPVAEIQRAFDLFFQGDTGKVVIEQGYQ